MEKEKLKLTKKIFIDGHSFDTQFQGTTSYLIGLYSELLKNHQDIELYIGAKTPHKAKKFFENFSNVFFIKYKSSSSLTRIFFEIPKIINQNKFDYAHFQYIIPFRRKKDCKYLVTIHDILFEDFKEYFPFFYRMIRKVFFKYSALNADKIFTVSEYSKSRLVELYNIKSDKIFITHNGINEHFLNFKTGKKESSDYIFEKYGIKKYLLYVSRIEPRKNHLELANLLLKNNFNDNFNLVFIGSNSLNPNFHKKINELNQNKNRFLFWLEGIDTKDLLHFYNASEAFIFPSVAEGFGIPPLEAGILNIPVLCSNSTAMSDFDFFEPYFFDPFNQKEFESKLIEFIKNHKNVDTNSIKNSIIKKYSWKKSSYVFFHQLS